MRIAAGFLKNREIRLPKGFSARPTSAKVRAQVFNICQHTIEGSHFLDIFAGSGAMGFEAISRGATSCTFIENDKKALRALYENIERLSLTEQCRVIGMDAFKGIERLKQTFSIVYIDPPYTYDKTGSLVSLVDSHLSIENGGYVFIETRKGTLSLPSLSTLQCVACKKTGDTELFVLRP